MSVVVVGALEGPSAPEAASAAPSRLEGDQAAEREKKPARGAASDCGGETPARAGPVAATPRRAIGQITPRGAEGLPLKSAALSRLERVAGVITAVESALEGPSAPEATSASPSLLEGVQAVEREREPARGATNECGGEGSAWAQPVVATSRSALGRIAPRGAGGSPLLSAAPSRLEGEGEWTEGGTLPAEASGRTPSPADQEERVTGAASAAASGPVWARVRGSSLGENNAAAGSSITATAVSSHRKGDNT